MKFSRAFFLVGLLGAEPLRAVYAPVPEREQGKAWVVTAHAAATYDSNIFGSATDRIHSMVYELSPKAEFNVSLTPQTFLSSSYQLTLDDYENRPGDKLLDSHALHARLAHQFSPGTTLDLNDTFSSSRNPESLLNGLSVNTDQSLRNNAFDGTFVTALNPKVGVTLKGRSTLYRFRNDNLSADLDRTENLYGVAGDFAALKELKLVAEYRHQDIFYRTSGSNKDKKSDFLMTGADYSASDRITASARVGYEWRHRDAERSSSAPYVELAARYAYGEKSYVASGYTFTFEEASNVDQFTDTRVNRIFVNVQHALTPSLFLAAALDYEPSRLRGRRGFASIDETATHAGVALSYQTARHWTLTASYDHDDTDSDDSSRLLRRNRAGLGASYAF